MGMFSSAAQTLAHSRYQVTRCHGFAAEIAANAAAAGSHRREPMDAAKLAFEKMPSLYIRAVWACIYPQTSPNPQRASTASRKQLRPGIPAPCPAYNRV